MFVEEPDQGRVPAFQILQRQRQYGNALRHRIALILDVPQAGGSLRFIGVVRRNSVNPEIMYSKEALIRQYWISKVD